MIHNPMKRRTCHCPKCIAKNFPHVAKRHDSAQEASDWVDWLKENLPQTAEDVLFPKNQQEHYWKNEKW